MGSFHTVTITHTAVGRSRTVCSETSVPAETVVDNETFLRDSVNYLEAVAKKCPHKNHKTVVDRAAAPEVPRV